MSNVNPWKARLKRHQKRWPRPIAELQAEAYSVLQLALEGVAVEEGESRRKSIFAYFQALTSFMKLYETTELEARLAALEAHVTLEGQQNGQH
jgi:hypothetical protein